MFLQSDTPKTTKLIEKAHHSVDWCTKNNCRSPVYCSSYYCKPLSQSTPDEQCFSNQARILRGACQPGHMATTHM